jgi:hypothetical protein
MNGPSRDPVAALWAVGCGGCRILLFGGVVVGDQGDAGAGKDVEAVAVFSTIVELLGQDRAGESDR